MFNSGWEKWNAASTSAAKALRRTSCTQSVSRPRLFAVRSSSVRDLRPTTKGRGVPQDIQNRVGIWHDKLMLAQLVLETFSGSNGPPDADAMTVIRDVKEMEIGLAESERDCVMSIPKTKDYRHPRTVLSAAIYAMPWSS